MPLPTRVLGQAVKLVADTADRVRRPPADGVVVLLYHRVGGRARSEIDVPLGLFEEQIAAVAASGGAGPLDDAVEHLAGRRGAGPRVVVTFDDGTDDVVEAAVPVLARHGVPALLYVATDFVEQGRPFPNKGRPASWKGLADAMAAGVLTIGSHTHTHALLDRLAAPAIVQELDRSIGLIEDRLGATPRHFAYPKALLGSPAAQEAVHARFASAALAGCRANRPGSTDLWRLARSPIQVSDGMRYFSRKLAGGMALEQTLRELKNRRGYRALTT